MLRALMLSVLLAAPVLAQEEVDLGSPPAGTYRPDPANRAVYDRSFAEFPRLYRSQRRMFHRLNATPVLASRRHHHPRGEARAARRDDERSNCDCR